MKQKKILKSHKWYLYLLILFNLITSLKRYDVIQTQSDYNKELLVSFIKSIPSSDCIKVYKKDYLSSFKNEDNILTTSELLVCYLSKDNVLSEFDITNELVSKINKCKEEKSIVSLENRELSTIIRNVSEKDYNI